MGLFGVEMTPIVEMQTELSIYSTIAKYQELRAGCLRRDYLHIQSNPVFSPF